MTSFHVIAAPSIILIIAILFGNSLVIASYKINRRLKTRTNAFLVSLAVSDFLVGSISLPMCIYGITSERNVSIAFNAVFKSVDVFAALASIFHLTAISMERYIAVSRPFYYKRLPSLFQRVLITTAWSAACFLALLSNFTLLENSWSSQCYSLVLFICGLVVLLGCPLQPTAMDKNFVPLTSFSSDLIKHAQPRITAHRIGRKS